MASCKEKDQTIASETGLVHNRHWLECLRKLLWAESGKGNGFASLTCPQVNFLVKHAAMAGVSIEVANLYGVAYELLNMRMNW